MEVIFTSRASADLNYWKKTGNTAIQKKIKLIEAIKEDPITGLGNQNL